MDQFLYKDEDNKWVMVGCQSKPNQEINDFLISRLNSTKIHYPMSVDDTIQRTVGLFKNLTADNLALTMELISDFSACSQDIGRGCNIGNLTIKLEGGRFTSIVNSFRAMTLNNFKMTPTAMIGSGNQAGAFQMTKVNSIDGIRWNGNCTWLCDASNVSSIRWPSTGEKLDKLVWTKAVQAINNDNTITYFEPIVDITNVDWDDLGIWNVMITSSSLTHILIQGLCNHDVNLNTPPLMIPNLDLECLIYMIDNMGESSELHTLKLAPNHDEIVSEVASELASKCKDKNYTLLYSNGTEVT